MTSNRSPEPEIVRQWREWDKMGPPRCCHTCDFYEPDGHCRKHKQRPPDDFAATPDACPDWTREVPF